MDERTLMLIKPDAVRRALVGEIIGRVERCGLRIVNIRLFDRLPEALCAELYAEHLGKPHYERNARFMQSGPMWALVVEGVHAIARLRQIMGSTTPVLAEPGTIRGDLATDLPETLVHGSDGQEAAEREIRLFFG